MFPYVHKLKKKFQFEEEGIGIVLFVGFQIPLLFNIAKKLPSLITNVLLQLVRDIIKGVCYQRYEKRLEQEKDHPDVNVCATEEDLEEEL